MTYFYNPDNKLHVWPMTTYNCEFLSCYEMCLGGMVCDIVYQGSNMVSVIWISGLSLELQLSLWKKNDTEEKHIRCLMEIIDSHKMDRDNMGDVAYHWCLPQCEESI